MKAMRTRFATRILATTFGLTLALQTVPRDVLRAQSLGEVAKKEEERRKQLAKPGKVYTNKDVTPAPPVLPPPPTPAATGDAKDSAAKPADDKKAADAKDAKKEGDAKPGADAKGQSYWSERMKTLRANLDRDSAFAEALQTQINALTTDFVNRDDPVQKSAIDRNRQKALAQLETVKKQVQDDKKAIADVEEEARRAGVPPGWLR